ncbi:GNAT family N-acetyltransferase [Pseudovibrio sp. Ad37]|uniref:GNAT family N-acetyltransferase n=1 Tax=Pseudovibrio sp. Ad37 TaxID=989422 RepID=UPI0007B1B33D|nr:GNAT family N-acetyltransferase [Pseudovibrio sp. Ad37]KZL20161.1 Acetyltransferase (GNAT) family protein [Pseudovibrio sp. Ad37]
MVNIREAVREDAQAMSAILAVILESQGSDRPRSTAHVLSQYVEHPDRIRCSVALDENNNILGFQSLRRASAGNVYDLPAGWGIIGTYVSATASRKGVGRALFTSSLEAAGTVGLSQIDATIGEMNELGLAYYEAMGFCTYRVKPGAICKKLTV